MDRKKLQGLAKMRLKDAQILLGRKRWSGAYYLCGYSIECALKACLLRHLGESDAVFGNPDYRKLLADCWTHDLVKLVDLAGLKTKLDSECSANSAFRGFWGQTKAWKETSRYQELAEAEARALYEAVSNNPDGVFRWIQSYW